MAISDASGQSFSTSSKGPKKDLFWPIKLFLTKRENKSVIHKNRLQNVLRRPQSLPQKPNGQCTALLLNPELVLGTQRCQVTNELSLPLVTGFLWYPDYALTPTIYCPSNKTSVCVYTYIRIYVYVYMYVLTYTWLVESLPLSPSYLMPTSMSDFKSSPPSLIWLLPITF